MKKKSTYIISLIVVCTIFVAVCFTTSNVYADEYDDLIDKYCWKISGYDPQLPYNINDVNIAKSLDILDVLVEQYWLSMNGNHTWSDLEQSSLTSSANITEHYNRLKKMAEAWVSYGSDYYNNSSILNDIISGLEWGYNNRYNENRNWYGNWWDWEIGIPSNLNCVVIMIYDSLSQTQRSNYMRAVNRFTPDVTTSYCKGYAMVGANLLWKCQVMCVSAIIEKNSSRIQQASAGMSKVFEYATSGDGFYEDGSFLQHENVPYTGGYGQNLLASTAELMWLLSGTPWENTSTYKSNVYEWAIDSFEPFMIGGIVSDSVCGRNVARQPSVPVNGGTALEALILLAEDSSNPYIDKFKSLVKQNYQNGYRDALFESKRWRISKTMEILNNSNISPADFLTGNFIFHNQDRVVHRKNNWFFEIAMHSNRILNFEVMNGENRKGWYSSDGMTYLRMLPGDYSFNYWSTVDPHRLPGITVDRNLSRQKSTGLEGDRGDLMANNWVGGVSLEGSYGTAGMDFKQHDSGDMNLTAKKSWFMFDDEIVALGTGINSTTGRTIETVIENRSLNSQGNNEVKVDGVIKPATLGYSESINNTHWIHLEGTGGYVFPDATNINVLREQRTGEYLDINDSAKTGDNFNNTFLKGYWSWIRKDDTHYSLNGSALNITTQKGSLKESVNTTKNVLLTPVESFDSYVTTKLNFSPSITGQEAGLIFYVDDDNYVYISRGIIAGEGQKIIATSESNGIYTYSNIVDNYGTDLYLKILKEGSDYKMYASSNGISWGSAVFTCTNAMAGTDGFNSKLKMGLFAQNGNYDSVPEIAVSFDDFTFKCVRNYFTAWIEHGQDPVDGAYNYVILPGKTSSEVSAYNNNMDTEILKRTDNVHAVREKTLGITGINFWEAANVGYITAYNPASMMIKDRNNQLSISVSDPTQTQSKLIFEICKGGGSLISKDDSITVLQYTPTIIFEVDVSSNPGSSHNVAFNYDPQAATLSNPQIIRVYPVDDSYVRAGAYGNNNYGSSTNMEVKVSQPDTNRESFMKFDLSSITGDIASAKLNVYGEVSDTAGTEVDCNVYGVNSDSWSESTIIWSNKPAKGSFLATTHFTDDRSWRENDITSFVQQQYSQDKVVSLTMIQENITGLYVNMNTKENTSNKPYIELKVYPYQIIPIQQDSHVRGGIYANNNYGSSAQLEVKDSAPDTNREAYMMVNLNSIFNEVASAKLYIYGEVNDGQGTEIDCKIFGVNDDTWSESTITWNNKPFRGSYLSYVNFIDPRTWKEADITSFIRQEHEEDGIASLAIVQEAGGSGLYVGITSKDHNSSRPYVKIYTIEP